jgi:hypothetical protein
VAHGVERLGQHMTVDGIGHRITSHHITSRSLIVCTFLGSFGLGGRERDYAGSACRAVHEYRVDGFKACFSL